MKFFYLLLLTPVFITAQVKPAFVLSSNHHYSKLEYSGNGLFGFELKGKVGYIDKNGTVVIPAIYSLDSITSTVAVIPYFQNGYVKVIKDRKSGLVDKAGKIIIPIEHESLSPYTQFGNFVLVTKTISGKKNYGLLTLQNKELIPTMYEDIRVDTNMATVKQNGKWGLFDKNGKQLLPFEYNYLAYSSTNKVLVAEKGTQYGVIDLTGKWLFEKTKSVFSLYSCKNGMVLCKVNNKYGYLDLKGDEVIIAKYDNAYDFENNGLAKVGKKSPANTYSSIYGFIDKKGNEVIPVKYESLGSFYNNLVYAKDPETTRYGYMDKNGKWILNPVFLDATNFDNAGGAWVKMTDAKYHYINKTGTDLGLLTEAGTTFKTFDKDGFAVYENTEYPYALIDKSGRVLKTIDDCDGIYTFSDGIAGYKSKAGTVYGFLDINGNKIIPPDYSGFTAFIDGISKVSQTINGKTKSGYITSRNEMILPVKYDTLYGFRDGWGLMKNNGKYFFVDRNGNLKDPPREYDELLEFRSGFALGKMKGHGDASPTYYYINTQLKEAFSITAWKAYLFWEDVAIISKDDKVYEIINKKGEIIKRLENTQTLKFCSDGMFAVKEAGKWGFLNAKGETIVKPIYDSTESFKHGYGRVKSGTKWGIVDKSGTIVLDISYNNIFPGENGIFIFYDGSGWGIMDKTGKILKEPVLNTLTTFEKDRALARLGKTYTILKSPLTK